MGLKDGMKSLEINATTVSGGTVIGDTLTAGASEIGAAEIAGGAVTSGKILSGNVLTVHISGAQVTTAKLATDAVDATVHNLIGTGSPTTFGQSIQYGTVNTDGGSLLWTVFGTAFTAAPTVVVGGGTNSAGWFRAQTVVAGSFLTHSEAASQSGTWIAIGSGAL